MAWSALRYRPCLRFRTAWHLQQAMQYLHLATRQASVADTRAERVGGGGGVGGSGAGGRESDSHRQRQEQKHESDRGAKYTLDAALLEKCHGLGVGGRR
jgi:hypothetical protein